LTPKAAYWRRENADGGIVCELCPHGCHIADGHFGLCKVRKNEGGALALPFFSRITSLAEDPIEKKPLYHFLPGSHVFSVGFAGCNMRCPFCQNWRISQEIPSSLEALDPQGLIAMALKSGLPSIAYTYSEPTVHFEFVAAAMSAARAVGLKNVLVTNGTLESGPARELLNLTDAVNVDLKTWSSETYKKVLGGRRETVLSFIEEAFPRCHIEVTTLIVPEISDSMDDMTDLSGFLAGISPDIPLHISAYHPAWKHDAPPTSISHIEKLATVARKKLRFVYLGNIQWFTADTVCPQCLSKIVSRRGYAINLGGLKISGSSVNCATCGYALPIILSKV